MQSTPFSLAGGKAAFGSIRPGAARSGFEDDDEDEDDRAMMNGQKVELREGAISLEQVGCFFSADSSHHDHSFVLFLGEADRDAEYVEKPPILIFVCLCVCDLETISDSLLQSIFFESTIVVLFRSKSK